LNGTFGLKNTKLKQLLPILAALILTSACDSPPYEEHPGLESLIPDASGMNVLIISFDALRADVLGLYGFHRPTSPKLDEFAKGALVFDNAYAAAPTTPTSFAAAFTGQYPYRVFIGWKLVPAVTLASMMKEAGYHSFGLFNNMQLAEERNFHQGFDDYRVVTQSDRRLLKDAKTLLGNIPRQPFFGWIHFISPHTPYDYREMSSHLAGPEEEGRYAKTTGGTFDVANDEELKRVRELYDGEVFFADHLFGKIMEHLESLGLLENTVIIVTSDHGEEFMEHGQLQHNALFEELVRIPMIIRHPGMQTGARTDARFVNVDLLPTIAGMTGLVPPENIDGLNLYRPFNGLRYRISTAMTNKQRYEIMNEFKAMKFVLGCLPEFREELYDLQADPKEQVNLIRDEAKLADELYDALFDYMDSEPCQRLVDAKRGKAPTELLSSEQIEKLKSLGYIQ
jgi:arylsulfatase